MSAAASPVPAPHRTRRWRRSFGHHLLGWAGLAVALGLWQLLAVVLDKTVFPSFSQALAAVGELLSGPVLTDDILPSVGRALAGFAISAVLGIVLGLVLGYVRRLGDYCSAVIDFLRSVPSPLLVPLALVVMGLGGKMVIAVIVSAAVWPVMLNAFDAVHPHARPLAGRAAARR